MCRIFHRLGKAVNTSSPMWNKSIANSLPCSCKQMAIVFNYSQRDNIYCGFDISEGNEQLQNTTVHKYTRIMSWVQHMQMLVYLWLSWKGLEKVRWMSVLQGTCGDGWYWYRTDVRNVGVLENLSVSAYQQRPISAYRQICGIGQSLLPSFFHPACICYRIMAIR